jgi:hypothetical protein
MRSANVRNTRSRTLLSLIAMSAGILVITSSSVIAQSLRGTAPRITVTTAVPGSEPTPVTSTSSQIRYSGKVYLSKITVSTLCPGQKFDLSVVATGSFSGHGSPVTVNLMTGALAADFITGIPANSNQNTPTLQYTASPQFSDGTGTDTHTVTYTQVAQ